MIGAPESFVFERLPSSQSADAFAFHQKMLASNGFYLWPRDLSDIRRFANDGELFGVRNSAGKLVGICYATMLSEKERTTIGENGWELGGVTVEKSVQHLGIGTLLVRFALGHTIALNRPWYNKQQIITLVHEENNKPQALLKLLGFENSGEVKFDEAPPAIKRNASGKVVAHKFVFPHNAVRGLYDWFKNFNGSLNNEADIWFSIPPADIKCIWQALEEALNELDN